MKEKNKKEKTLVDRLLESGVSEVSGENAPMADIFSDEGVKKIQERWVTSISVPQEAEAILQEISLKLLKLKVRPMKLGMRWYTGIVLFNELLNYVDPAEVDAGTDICNYLLQKIRKKMKTKN